MDAEIQHQALKLVLESESERVRGLKKELEEMETNRATIIAQKKEPEERDTKSETIIAQLKEKIKSKEEFILILKHESQEQIKKLQQQLKEKEDEIASIQVLYGKQHQV